MKRLLLGLGFAVIGALVGCGGGSGGGDWSGGSAGPIVGSPAPGSTAGPRRSVVVDVRDVALAPIVGAKVAITTGGVVKETQTDDRGLAAKIDLLDGDVSIAVTAEGFESYQFMIGAEGWTDGELLWRVRLQGEGAVAIGRAVVLGSRVTELSADGSAMIFEVDVAVVDADSAPIETLSAGDFSFAEYDCGGGGDGDCASDAERRPTGSGGQYHVDGGVLDFDLQPAGARKPYVVGVLTERSNFGVSWSVLSSVLKSFFGALGGNDTASLMSVQEEFGATKEEDGTTIFRSYGAFTSDGASFFAAIDALPQLAGGYFPAIAGGLAEAINRTAAADAFGLADVERHVLVLGQADLSPADVRATAELAERSGVQVSMIKRTWAGLYGNSYGISELAARAQGVIAGVDDDRQLALLFGALDSLLAGTVPYYRLQFRLTGADGTFVPGGNVRLILVVDMPSPLPNAVVATETVVAIP